MEVCNYSSVAVLWHFKVLTLRSVDSLKYILLMDNQDELGNYNQKNLHFEVCTLCEVSE